MKTNALLAVIIVAVSVHAFGQALKQGTIMHTQGVRSAEANVDIVKAVESLNLPEQKGRWDKGPRGDWHVHFAKAVEEAVRENKCLYVLQTGSDWCPWCVKLHDEVLDSSKFKKFAKKNLVLLYLDFPRKKKMGEGQSEHNQKVVQTIGLSGGYPTAAILAPNGAVLDKISGFRKTDEYIKLLQAAIDKAPKKDVVPKGGVPGVNPKPMKPLQKKER